MTGRGLVRSVRDDLRRHWRHLFAGAVGITFSIAALAYFLALGLGIRAVLLGEVFPVDRIEVHRTSTDLNLLAIKLELGSDTLGAPMIERLAAIDGVSAVYPKMRLLVPALASGGESLIGAGMQTELVADGVDPALVADDVGDAFHDPRFHPDDDAPPCRGNRACPNGTVCVGASVFGPGECREEIPVIVSEHMVELYNGAFRRAYRLPKVNPRALVGLGGEIAFGASSMLPSGPRVVRHRAVLVGYSDAAIPLGVTMPLGFVRQLNRELGPRGADQGFHSAVLEVAPKGRAPQVIEAVESLGLEVRDGGARRAAFFMTMLLAAIALVGIVILTVSSIHVMHVFALLVMIRRHEIGVLRAVGARTLDVRVLLVVEAATVGFVAGLIGTIAAVVLGRVTDRALAGALPDLPFRPETLFDFEPWVVAGALVLATVACVLGALGPALRATSADPAETLR
jgi:hypothetical protein